MTIADTIRDYYIFRGLTPPIAENALLFFLSEATGEISEAYLALGNESTPSSTREILLAAVRLGQTADDIVSSRAEWVRNGDRHKEPVLADEIGDARMMLEVFAAAMGLPDSESCLLAKMAKKGFTPAAESQTCQILTDAEWASLSPLTRHRLNLYAEQFERMSHE